MDIGTRDAASNTQGGAVQIYIGDGATLSAQSDYGTSMATADVTTLLSSFQNVGQIGDMPNDGFTPNSYDKIDANGNKGKRQISSNVKIEIVLHEVDNTIYNELMAYAEGGDPVDILLMKGQAVGDYFKYVRNQTIQVERANPNSFEETDTIKITVETTAKPLYNVYGQINITA